MKSAQMLDALIRYPDHPLMVETKRECLENYWDVKGVIRIIKAIQT